LVTKIFVYLFASMWIFGSDT